MEQELLRLFKGYYSKQSNDESKEVSEEALKYGILIKLPCDEKIIKEAIKQYGKDGEKWNKSFHKSFGTVADASIDTLIIQQLVHYFTTYGFEDLDIYDKDTVYIPKEKLEIPELDKDIEMIVIKPLSSKQIKDKIMKLVTSGIALSEQTVQDIISLSRFIDKNKIDEISNREVKTALYDKLEIVPKNPDEFFRYLLFKTTGETLKIRNDKMISEIIECDKELALKMLNSYILDVPNGLAKLSSIFLRNKDLFLAFKIGDNYSLIKQRMNHLINKLKKESKHNHKPLNKQLLDCLSSSATDLSIAGITKKDIEEALDKVTIFRETRILNGLLYRENGKSDIVYKIRNSSAFVSKLKQKNDVYYKELKPIIKIIQNHLIARVSKIVKGKTIYIQDNITYAMPTSEKQFIGNIPEGSYIEIPRDDSLVYGIYWENINGERVDLDLKQMNKNEMFGWDASYRDDNKNILFSGDVTDAPDGASELFYLSKEYQKGAFLITLNMYTRNSEDVPFKFVIASQTGDIHQKYVINPNNILSQVNMVCNCDKRQATVGLITIDKSIKLYLNNFNTVNAMSSSRNDITMGAFNYLMSYNEQQLKLKTILLEAGATICDTKETVEEVATECTLSDGSKKVLYDKVTKPVDIDLSLESITKETLISLLNN